MKRKNVLLLSVTLLLSMVFVTSCYKVTTVDLSSDLEITRDVTFVGDMVPLLEKNCSLSGCHNTGGISPDLSSVNAYNSLTNGGYINVDNPNASRLYGFVSGELTPAMPVSGVDPEIAALILAWIRQGAQNN